MVEKIEQVEQGTEAWENFRSRGIGASDISAVIGASPWKTRLQLWEEKTRRREGFKGNYATTKGANLERKIRAHYELITGIEMKPTLAIHKDYDCMRCSLDGWNAKLNKGLEIKFVGAKDQEMAKSGKIPEKYWPQVQGQILYTGADSIDYISYDEKTYEIITVLPDIEYCRILQKEILAFWELVQTDTPPPPDPKRDYTIISDSSLEAYISDWKMLDVEYRKIKQELESIEEKIRSGLQINRGLCNGARLTKSQRRGSIQYKNIKELQGVDLESYRSEPVEVFSIKLLKE